MLILILKNRYINFFKEVHPQGTLASGPQQRGSVTARACFTTM